MESNDLLRTIKATILYDPKYQLHQEQLASIILRSELEIIQSSAFTSTWNQRSEYATLRVPLPLIKLARELEPEINKLIFGCYVPSDEFGLVKVSIEPKTVSSDEELEQLLHGLDVYQTNEASVRFSDLQKTILSALDDAKYCIWVAVAWITDPIYCQKLLECKNRGVSIRIVLNNDNINAPIINKLKSDFEVKAISPFGYFGNNIMHDKFCIIDFDYVLSGSYNWTKKAEYNNENIVTSVGKQICHDFADEFLKLFSH